MKDLFMEGGYVSINKHDQPVCGDFYTTVKTVRPSYFRMGLAAESKPIFSQR